VHVNQRCSWWISIALLS